MNSCKICASSFQSFEGNPEICSASCSKTEHLLGELQSTLIKTQPSEDPRIFFYPLSFGSLVDQYSVLCLKRIYSDSIGFQQKVDYLIFKIKKSIETNLAQLFYDETLRKNLSELTVQLFQCNASVWRLKRLARDERLPLGNRKDFLYSTLENEDKRHHLIRQLDILVSGKTVNHQIY